MFHHWLIKDDRSVVLAHVPMNIEDSEAIARLMSKAWMLPQMANLIDVLARVADTHNCQCKPGDCVIAEARQLFDTYEAQS